MTTIAAKKLIPYTQNKYVRRNDLTTIFVPYMQEILLYRVVLCVQKRCSKDAREPYSGIFWVWCRLCQLLKGNGCIQLPWHQFLLASRRNQGCSALLWNNSPSPVTQLCAGQVQMLTKLCWGTSMMGPQDFFGSFWALLFYLSSPSCVINWHQWECFEGIDITGSE